jgi:hypothetical protein
MKRDWIVLTVAALVLVGAVLVCRSTPKPEPEPAIQKEGEAFPAPGFEQVSKVYKVIQGLQRDFETKNADKTFDEWPEREKEAYRVNFQALQGMVKLYPQLTE